MRKYFNVEIRVATEEVLNNIPGSIGQRALVLATGLFYYWNPTERTWVVEGQLDYTHYTCQLFSGGGYVYDNVLGNHTLPSWINWVRLDTGLYRGTLEGAFPVNRTLFVHPGFAQVGFNQNTSPSSSAVLSFVSVVRVDDDTIFVSQYSAEDRTPIDGLESYDLEIRVYAENNYRD